MTGAEGNTNQPFDMGEIDVDTPAMDFGSGDTIGVLGLDTALAEIRANKAAERIRASSRRADIINHRDSIGYASRGSSHSDETEGRIAFKGRYLGKCKLPAGVMQAVIEADYGGPELEPEPSVG